VGMFHYRLLAICGLSFMADAMEVSLLSFMAPCVGLSWALADSEIAGIASAVFAGILLGSLCWGPVADVYGRRLSYLWGASLIILGGIISAFCTSYVSLIIFRAIVGFGVGGISVPFDLLAEYIPASHRGQYLMYIEYFWTLGSMFVAACAWIFLEKYDWRVLTLVTAVPVTVGLSWSICYLPESPRWLLQQGRVGEAEQCVARMAAVNGLRLPPFRLTAPAPAPGQAMDDSRGSDASSHRLQPAGDTRGSGSGGSSSSGGGACEDKPVSVMDFLRRDQLGRGSATCYYYYYCHYYY
jgi:MFS family permease